MATPLDGGTGEEMPDPPVVPDEQAECGCELAWTIPRGSGTNKAVSTGMRPELTPPARPDPVAPSLCALRAGQVRGEVTHGVTPTPGIALHADSGLTLGGQYRSPAGRLLELEVEAAGQGQWLGLHIALCAPDLFAATWLTLTCRSAARGAMMIRPCLRSGQASGFVDCFFDKHILADHTPRAHIDGLHLPSTRAIPDTAPWRELVLFLPRESFTWHLHDLRVDIS